MTLDGCDRPVLAYWAHSGLLSQVLGLLNEMSPLVAKFMAFGKALLGMREQFFAAFTCRVLWGFSG